MGDNNTFNVVIMIITFIFFINFGAFGLVITYGVVNDYIMYDVVDLAEGLSMDGVLPLESSDQVQIVANKYKDTFELWDLLLFSFYLLFIASTFYLSYITDKENYFTAFGTLLFVGMIFLFFISLFVSFSDWWSGEVLIKLLPSFGVLFPKYGWIMKHIGLLAGVQLGLCILLNLVDFDISGLVNRKTKEQKAVDNEVL